MCVSDPEQRDGYLTVTYPYSGNSAFGRAIKDAEELFGEITVMRVHQGWYGTTITYKEGKGVI